MSGERWAESQWGGAGGSAGDLAGLRDVLLGSWWQGVGLFICRSGRIGGLKIALSGLGGVGIAQSQGWSKLLDFLALG